MDERNQKSYVLHEFGHALGLEHEHQRSDFWNLLEDLLSPTSVSKKWLKENEYLSFKDGAKRVSTKYDPCSIMHYW